MTIVLSSTNSSGFGIANYGDLKEKTALWLNRGTSLDDEIPTFVQLAESMIRRDVRVRVQEVLTSGTATEETIDAPEDALEFRRVIVGGKRKTYCTPEEFQDLDYADSQEQKFTVIGESIYVLGGALDSDYSLLYWEQFEHFAIDTDTNWLLLNAPEIYLWSSCKEGAEYLKDFEAADRFNGKYLSALKVLNDTEKAMRFSGSTLAIRPRGSTP
jgi:hypothetical protein